MNGIRKTAMERETLGRDTGLVGLGFVALGWGRSALWLVVLGLVVAVVGGIMWAAGMARSD